MDLCLCAVCCISCDKFTGCNSKILLPVAVAIGLLGPVFIGLMPATYAYFFIPNYPSDIATVNFDISGTTKIGKYYFNHSFMAPGLIGLIVACVIGLTLT